jgi:hypothetical protein
LDKKRQIYCQQLLKLSNPACDIQHHNDPQMSLDYHLVDPLMEDDEKDEQQSDVLDGC